MSRRGRDTVLVVDDEESTLDSTLALLTSHGYEAVGANSGRTALALLRDADVRARVILLDLHMPGMDGWQFRTELLCHPDLARIPIVIVSASGGPVVRAAAEAMRAAAALVKPVDGEELLRLVARLTAGT
jgi:two-component system, sensor histidine kinase